MIQLTPEQMEQLRAAMDAKPKAARCVEYGIWCKSNPDICKLVNDKAKAAGESAQGAISTYFTSVWNSAGFAEQRKSAEAKYAEDMKAYYKLIGKPEKKRKRETGDGADGNAKPAKLTLGVDLELIKIDGADWVIDADGYVRKLTGAVYVSEEAALAAVNKAKSKAAAKKAKTPAAADSAESEDDSGDDADAAEPAAEAGDSA
jgi:hypothetical protein